MSGGRGTGPGRGQGLGSGRGQKHGPTPPLHLHAVEPADLPVVSAALSGAAVKRADMGLDRARRRFAFVCNRFRWEDDIVDDVGGTRIRAGLQFNDVRQVRTRGLAGLDGETVLELLSVTAEAAEPAPAATITLTFAGGGAIVIETDCIDVLMDDMGRPWYTPNRPHHSLDDDPSGTTQS